MPGCAAGRPATSTSTFTSSRTDVSGATATMCTWCCRLRSTKPGSVRESRWRPPTARLRVRVPPGTQSGQRFRLRERGVPTRDGGRGDLVVEVRLTLPRLLDERSKELLREFGRINGESVRAAD